MSRGVIVSSIKSIKTLCGSVEDGWPRLCVAMDLATPLYCYVMVLNGNGLVWLRYVMVYYGYGDLFLVYGMVKIGLRP